MKFGPLAVKDAEGAILAHSLIAGKSKFRKGLRLDADVISQLDQAGITEVLVAQPEPGDWLENEAASLLANALVQDPAALGIRVDVPFTGRVNLFAERDGLLRVQGETVRAINSIDPDITLATLPDYTRVAAGNMLATVKIIPYAVPGDRLEAALGAVTGSVFEVHGFKRRKAALILTQNAAVSDKVLAKGREVTRRRLDAIGVRLSSVETVAHETGAVAAALGRAKADMVLILGASATSDRRDICPAGLVAAGGVLTRFGMPVDPGNLLFLGELNGKPVVGMPGCCRSPALNGVDWVLERLMADLPVSHADIAAMGVGGLLKEVPARTQPRRIRTSPKPPAPHILLLAAGQSSRMRGDNKLLREIDGVPLVLRSAQRLAGSKAAGISIVVNSDNTAIKQALTEHPAPIIEAKDAASGLAASLRAGINGLPPEASAVIIALADMPDVTAADIDALIDGFDPKHGALIVAPTAPNGKRGNPVLFDRRYFEPLASLTGDTGAKALIEAESDALRLIPRGSGVLVDLDTPEAWADWQASRDTTSHIA